MMPDSHPNGPTTALLFLHAQTALHPGSGTALGTVDLPVQRERHTQWPLVPGTSLKGVLRDVCRDHAREQYADDGDDVLPERRRSRRRKANEEDPDLVAAFGPGRVDESSSHAGALSFTDARILAFPVRSLRGVFSWVTCPAVLERLNRDLALAGRPGIQNVPRFNPGDREVAACHKQSPLLVSDDKLVLEEFEFTRTAGPHGTDDAKGAAGWIAEHAVSDGDTTERIRMHLAVLTDDDFTHFVRHSTEVVARVGLDYERKTVRTGALFYQEFLPAETLFYSVVFATASRRAGHARSAADLLGYLRENLSRTPAIQVGGDETTGKGICAVRLTNGKEK